MHARSMYRATLVSSATLASHALDIGGAAHSANDDEESGQGYWCQELEFEGGEQYLQYRHFAPRGADAPVYWNWRDGG